MNLLKNRKFYQFLTLGGFRNIKNSDDKEIYNNFQQNISKMWSNSKNKAI